MQRKISVLAKRLEQVERDVGELADIADALKELELFVAMAEEENCRCNERYYQQICQKLSSMDRQMAPLMTDISQLAELMATTLRDWDQHWPDEFLGMAQFCHRLGQEKIFNRELTPLQMAIMTLDPAWSPYMTGPKVTADDLPDLAKYLVLGKLAERFPQDWFVEHDLPDQCISTSLPHPNGKGAAEKAAHLQQLLKEARSFSLKDLLNSKTASSCTQQFCEMMQIASFLKEWRPNAEGVLLLTSCLRSGSLLSLSTLQFRLRAAIREHFDLCSRDEQIHILEALTWTMFPEQEAWSNMQRQTLGLANSSQTDGGFLMDDRYREIIRTYPRSQPGAELVRELRERFP